MAKKKASTRKSAKKVPRRNQPSGAKVAAVAESSDDAVTSELWRLHDAIQKLITLSDRKCAIVISVSLAFGAVAADTVSDHKGFSAWFRTDCGEPMVVLLSLTMLGLAVARAGFAIWPRGSLDHNASLFSWCRIAALDSDEIAKQMRVLMDKGDLESELSKQVHDLSRICMQKFEITRSSIWAAFLGILLIALHRVA